MDWIVVNATSQQMECLRCGAHEPLKLPALLQVFCQRAKTFIEAHGKCREGA